MPRIRAAEVADVPQIVELLRQGFPADLLGYTIFGCRGIGVFLEDAIRLSGVPAGGRFFVFTERDEVLAFAEIRWTLERLFLNQIFVRADSQKQGIGSRLLLEAIDRSRRLGQPTISLDVFTENRVARQWYESMGFSALEERVWLVAPLGGVEAGEDCSWFVSGLSEADRLHAVFGFSEFSLTTPTETYRVGRLGDDLFRSTDAQLPLDQSAWAALARIDPRRDFLGVFDAGAAGKFGFEDSAWFKKGSGTFAGTARRVLRTKVPDPFLNHAEDSQVKARSVRMSASVTDVLVRLAESIRG